MEVNFNINILNQLLVQYPDKVIAVNKKFPKFNEWQKDIKKPTINQLGDLANYFNIPFGYFFLKEIPVKKYPIRHYRTINKGAFKPSQELMDTIKIIEDRQRWAGEILEEFNNEPLYFANSITVEEDIKEVSQKIRDILGVHENWAKHEDFNTWYDAFKFLVTKVENAGIFVVINGVVGNDTHRKLNVHEFRGFVLYNDFAPFIFINNVDFVSGKIFTLIHEVVHVLLGKSASFDFSDLQPSNDIIEEFCDAVAAEFLVSTNSLIENFKVTGRNYQKLARVFKVSKIVIVRRLLDLGEINYAEFIDALNSFKSAKFEKNSDANGGDFYNNAPNRISRSFFNLLYSAVRQNKILYRDAFKLAGLTPKTFDGYVDKYINKPMNV
jgi:Zn-dependent peptidase ImmA (M78 family)